MSDMGTIWLTGNSGKTYLFRIYSLDTEFQNVGAVYVFTRAFANTRGGHTHSIIYIGQTGELGTRLSSHHKWECIIRNGANCVCICATGTEGERLAIEADLIRNFKPPCNDQLKSQPPLFRL